MNREKSGKESIVDQTKYTESMNALGGYPFPVQRKPKHESAQYNEPGSMRR